jgi:hypothetical protein
MKRKPAFQRRHYVQLAQAISRIRTLAPHQESPEEALRDLQEEIADLLARDNGNFSRDRFAEACKPTQARPHLNGHQHRAREA